MKMTVPVKRVRRRGRGRKMNDLLRNATGDEDGNDMARFDSVAFTRVLSDDIRDDV